MLNVPNYYIDDDLRIDRTDTANGIGGGILIYARKDILLKPVPNPSNFNQFCKFQVIPSDEKNPLNFTVFYRSPNSSAENTQELAKLIDKCENRSLFLGDLNLPNVNFEEGTTDNKGRLILETAESNFLTNSVNFTTHLRGNALDVCLSNIGDQIYNVED